MATALVGDPELLFLDEPTTGLDPQARRHLWDLVDELKQSGRTIILTTHYMDEAERLCDRVAIMDHGKVIALGTPNELIATIGGEKIVEFAIDSAPHQDLRGRASSHCRDAYRDSRRKVAPRRRIGPPALCRRTARDGAADLCFARAAGAAPERFPHPLRDARRRVCPPDGKESAR